MKESENNSYLKEEKTYVIEDDEINFNDLFQGILRRRKFVFSSTILIFLISIICIPRSSDQVSVSKKPIVI